MFKKLLWLVFLAALALTNGCCVDDLAPMEPGRWKTFAQLEADLRMITEAGYSRVCLFDLKSIQDYPDPRYIPLLRQYADDGLEITVYVQEVDPDQRTVELVRSVGASSVIVYEEDLLALFNEAGIRAAWWSCVAYPASHADRLKYLGWPDLRSEVVRRDIANWAVRVPDGVDGGLSLDYVRWNEVGGGRTAEQVTDLLRRIDANWRLKGDSPQSAAVYPYLDRWPRSGGALSVGQRWDEWLQYGLVDFVYPMAYISEDIPSHIDEWASYDVSRIVPCLSVANYD
jgi:hypothetical protein